MVTRVMLRVSSNQKDEVDAAFRYRIYRMAGVLVKKRLPTPFLLLGGSDFRQPPLSSSLLTLVRERVSQQRRLADLLGYHVISM
jgi:hypothetical protein